MVPPARSYRQAEGSNPVPIDPRTQSDTWARNWDWHSALDRDLAAWNADPSVGRAADLLSFALVPEARAHLRSVAESVVRLTGDDSSPVLHALARSITEATSSDDSQDDVLATSPEEQIRSLRAVLRRYPDDPLSLVDLARCHATLGSDKSAKRNLLVARSLAPLSRHVVRSSARYYVHCGDAEMAQSVLETAPSVSRDPWLLAALVSVCQITRRPSKWLRRAREVASRATNSPVHISELAGSLAMDELSSGRVRAARKLFEVAVRAPTENTLAQLHWATGELGRDFEMRPTWGQTRRMYELQAFRALGEGNVEVAMDSTRRWNADEPFSSRPIVMITFLLAIQGEFRQAIEWCRRGLRSNPDDPTLPHNLIYSLISSGEFDEAETRLIRMVARGRPPMMLANVGYLMLSQGSDDGRVYYERAIEAFDARGEREQAATALAFYARALRQAGKPDWRQMLDRALERQTSTSAPVVRLLARQMASGGSVDRPGSNLAIVQPPRDVKWRFDAASNTVVFRSRKLL